VAYPTFTATDLANFSGRDVATYTGYATTSALPQSILLFKIGTCLADLPEDPIKQELARMAILAMADAIVLSQPYQTVLANPFNSETIGSYSYSKVASAVNAGLPTGIAWFDMALRELSVCDLQDNIPSGGGIEIFEYDAAFAAGRHSGNVKLLSPKDIELSKAFGYDPSGNNYGVPINAEVEIDLDGFTQDGGFLEG
jgi:hypothetical protein